MEFYRFYESDLEPKSEMCYVLLVLFNSLNIRLKLEGQMVTLDSNCIELGEQKHCGTTTPSQVVTKEIHSVYTRGVAYIPYCLILMNKGVLKSQVSSIPEDVHSCYRNTTIPWYGSDTEMARYDEFLLWERPASGFHQSKLYRSTLENFNIPLNLH